MKIATEDVLCGRMPNFPQLCWNEAINDVEFHSRKHSIDTRKYFINKVKIQLFI